MAALTQPSTTWANFSTGGIAVLHRQSNPSTTLIPHVNCAAITNGGFGFRPAGTGVVSGVLTMANGAKPKVAILMDDAHGAPIASQLVDASGAYTFSKLRPGTYAVVALDITGTYRGKVIHTIVP